MTISTTMTDLLQLAEFESKMLTASAYQKLDIDDLDITPDEPLRSWDIQYNVVYQLDFGMAQGRYLSKNCAEMALSIRIMSTQLNQDLHNRASRSGHYDGLGDLEIARLESL